MGIIFKNIPIEAYHFIGMIKHYYGLLRQVCSIITTKILGIKLEFALQISFKAINNLVDPNGLVFTLLVFGIYPRISKLDILFASIIKHTITMKNTINEIWKCIASSQVNNVLKTWKKLSIAAVHDLPINSPILVNQKKNVG